MKLSLNIKRLVSLAVILMMALPAPAFAGTANYVYDSGGRLIWAKDGSTGKSYTYDQVGNRENVSGADPDIQVSPSLYGFGPVVINGTSSTQTFTFTNVGLANLTMGAGAVVLNGTDAGQFSIETDNCSSQTVTPGNNCTVGVQFSPTSGGDKSANLSVLS